AERRAAAAHGFGDARGPHRHGREGDLEHQDVRRWSQAAGPRYSGDAVGAGFGEAAMRGMLVSLTMLALLGACATTPAASGKTAVANDELILGCTDFTDMTPARLQQRFGAENITEETREGVATSVVFKDDPTRRLSVAWTPDRTKVAGVFASDVGSR